MRAKVTILNFVVHESKTHRVVPAIRTYQINTPKKCYLGERATQRSALTPDFVSGPGDEGGDDAHEYSDEETPEDDGEEGETPEQDLDAVDVLGPHLIEGVHRLVDHHRHAVCNEKKSHCSNLWVKTRK